MENINSSSKINFITLATQPNELKNLPRTLLAKIDEKAFQTFRVTTEERARARRLELDLQTKYVVDSKQLKGMEKMVGMKAEDIKHMMGIKV